MHEDEIHPYIYQGQEEIGLVENGAIRELKITALAIELDGMLYYSPFWKCYSTPFKQRFLSWVEEKGLLRKASIRVVPIAP